MSIAARMLVARFYDQHELSALQSEVQEFIIESMKLIYPSRIVSHNEPHGESVHHFNPTTAGTVAKWVPEIKFLTTFAFYGCSLYFRCHSDNGLSTSTIGQSLCSLFMSIPLKTKTINRQREVLLTLSSVCLLYSGLTYVQERSEEILAATKEIVSILTFDEKISPQRLSTPAAPEFSFSGMHPPPPTTTMPVNSLESVWKVILRALWTRLSTLGGSTHAQRLQSLFALFRDSHLLLFLYQPR